jgi:NADPH:quinone reductase-like Zn-dependent oxidoreductase
MLQAIVASRFVSQDLVPFIARASQEDLALLRQLIETGRVKPVIDRSYKLAEVREAIRYLEEGHVRGKLAIALA